MNYQVIMKGTTCTCEERSNVCFDEHRGLVTTWVSHCWDGTIRQDTPGTTGVGPCVTHAHTHTHRRASVPL